MSALTNLPAGVQAGAEAQAARQALYEYLKADEGSKAAAYDKAAQQLSKSISSAVAAEGLDAGTRQALEEVLDNIDGRGETGDNREQGRIGEPEDVTRNIVDTQGARNEQPLTKKQYDELVSHVIEFKKTSHHIILTAHLKQVWHMVTLHKQRCITFKYT